MQLSTEKKKHQEKQPGGVVQSLGEGREVELKFQWSCTLKFKSCPDN